jgi:hypothetical protein
MGASFFEIECLCGRHLQSHERTVTLQPRRRPAAANSGGAALDVRYSGLLSDSKGEGERGERGIAGQVEGVTALCAAHRRGA